MRKWLVPAIVLLLVGGGGMGVGWSLNEWQDGDGAPVPTEQPVAPTQTGPTQAEIEAEEREQDRLCLEAQQAKAAGEAAYDVELERKIEELEALGWSTRRASAAAPALVSGGGVPVEIQQAIERYCR